MCEVVSIVCVWPQARKDGCLHAERATKQFRCACEGYEPQHRKVALILVLGSVGLATSSVDPLRWGSWSVQ
jgi:hypothetical protein